jgi:hypothetical protein
MRASVLPDRVSTAAFAAVLAVLLAVPMAAQDRDGIARGIVRVLNAAVLVRASDGSAKVIVLHMPVDRDAALDLATKIGSAGRDVPALKLAAITLSVAAGVERVSATIQEQQPAGIVAYDLDASIVNRLGGLLRLKRILRITTRKDDVYNQRWAVAVTGPNSILYSSLVLTDAGFPPLGVGVEAIPPPPPESDKWYAPYVEGVRIAKLPNPRRASWLDVEKKMKQALDVRSRETKETINREKGAYLPHFYHGMALQKLGERDRALVELLESERQEVILDFAPLHKELRKLIKECQADQ